MFCIYPSVVNGFVDNLAQILQELETYRFELLCGVVTSSGLWGAQEGGADPWGCDVHCITVHNIQICVIHNSGVVRISITLV